MPSSRSRRSASSRFPSCSNPSFALLNRLVPIGSSYASADHRAFLPQFAQHLCRKPDAGLSPITCSNSNCRGGCHGVRGVHRSSWPSSAERRRQSQPSGPSSCPSDRNWTSRSSIRTSNSSTSGFHRCGTSAGAGLSLLGFLGHLTLGTVRHGATSETLGIVAYVGSVNFRHTGPGSLHAHRGHTSALCIWRAKRGRGCAGGPCRGAHAFCCRSLSIWSSSANVFLMYSTVRAVAARSISSPSSADALLGAPQRPVGLTPPTPA